MGRRSGRRLTATRYEQDVIAFVREMLDEIDDNDLDERLRIMLANRREDRTHDR
ncbi:hypothetical protein ACFRFL_18335 [Streptomyces sp. NPDC056708]|uniref:hypothetical protein n=1 Tax=unclassified Streptomyces TaxID=2593676 RepID=UPI003699E0B5